MQISGFLSYSRADRDIARWLVRRLERWRPPRNIRRKTGTDRLRVFRDVEDAELGELSDVIQTAIGQSDHLILLCSPAARVSDYVALEIRSFASVHTPERIIPVLVAGRPNAEVAGDDPTQDQAFPEALLEHFDEPLAADLRPRERESWFTRRRRQREAFFQVVARLLGVAKSDELVRRDRLQRQVRATAGAAVVVAVAITGTWWWWDARPKPGLDPLWRLTTMELPPFERDALSRLEAELSAAIPEKRPDRRLLLATWNIREFPRGPSAVAERGDAALTSIASILSRFDLVAVQEFLGDPDVFDPARQALLDRLGRHWAYVGSGPTDGRLGNGERLGFFFDTRSVAHGGELDEMVLTPEIMEAVGLDRQMARTPLVTAFDAGERRIWLANAHLYFGAAGGERRAIRTREFDALMRSLRRALDDSDDAATRFVVLGDLNFDRPDAPEARVARDRGFFFPAGLLQAGTAFLNDRPYDQIILSWDAATIAPVMTAGGVFPIFDHIYRPQDFDHYAAEVRSSLPRRDGDEPSLARVERAYLTRWRSYRISDHRPKWIELDLSEPPAVTDGR